MRRTLHPRARLRLAVGPGSPRYGGASTNPISFIAQDFSGSGVWVDAPEGEWVTNAVTVTDASLDFNGLDLIILVSNFTFAGQEPENTGRAYWDNFRVIVGGNLMFSDSFEIGLAPGHEGEVADAGWFINNSTEANSGVAVPASLEVIALGGLLGAAALRRRSR